MKLLLFVTKKNKYLVGTLMYGLGYFFYFVTNHYSVWPQHRLPLTWVDEHSPFLPYSVVIYVSEYYYFAIVFILLNNLDNISKYFYSFSALQLISCAFFMFYPTVYPRENFPISHDLPAWLQETWVWLRTLDTPGNCFPSLHVSSVYLTAFVLWTDRQKKLFWFFFVWATFIALSTLTTKQHYLADLLSGFVLSILCYRWFHFKQEYVRDWEQSFFSISN